MGPACRAGLVAPHRQGSETPLHTGSLVSSKPHVIRLKVVFHVTLRQPIAILKSSLAKLH